MIEPKTLYPEPELVTFDTAGKMLAFAREGWDLSVEDVANNLNLGVDVIEALERDQYGLLPCYTFVKGYVRAYAVLLRLNPGEVIKLMNLQSIIPNMTTSKNTQALKRKVYDRANKPTNNSGGLFVKSVLVIIFLVGISLFGLNQLSQLAVLLKLPIPAKSDNTANDTNEIIFPTQSIAN